MPFSHGASLWLRRSILVVSVIMGLFAMHTLPVMGMTSAASENQPMRPMAASHSALPLTPAVMADNRSGAQPPKGCGADHATCLAVLPSSSSATALAVAPASILPDALAGASLVSVLSVGSRAPPDVCLVRLCISRT